MAYGLYDGTLASIPGLGGYLQQNKINEGETANNLQQATQGMGLLSAIHAQQQQAQLKDVLSKSNGNLQQAIQGLIASGNVDGAAKLAPLLKLQQDQETAKLVAGAGQMTPDQLDVLGQSLAARGHPGAATVMSIADKRRQQASNAQTIDSMRDAPQGLTAGTTLPAAPGAKTQTEVVGDIPPEDVAAALKVAQATRAGQPMTAAPAPGDPMLKSGGALAPLLTSVSPAIAARARVLQGQINDPALKLDPATIQKQIDNLTAMDAKFTESRDAAKQRAGDQIALRQMMIDNRPATAQYSNVQQDGHGGWMGLNKDTQQMEQIPAAEGVKASGGALGNRESVYVNRVLTSAAQAAKDLTNVVRLPMSASTGLFGQRGQAPGIFNAGKETLANKMTSQDVQTYNVMATGFQRALAAIEASGLVPSGTLSHQMESVLFREGDTNLTKLQKLAQTRQIVESGMETTASNPRVPEETRDYIKKIIDSVQKAVPFTQGDLIDLQQAQQLNPNATLGDVVKALKTPAAGNGGWSIRAK